MRLTKKRFILDDDGIVTDMLDLSMYIDNEDCCEKLNELSEENKQLKEDNNRLVNETAKVVAEHQKKILDLIDEKIKETQKLNGVDTSGYYNRMNLLLELKEELQE